MRAASAAARAATTAATGAAARGIAAAAFITAAPAAHALGVRQFVTQTAFQAATQARQPGRIEAQILLFRHLDRDGFERVQKRGAAQRAAAGSISTQHLGFITRADLPHLDPRVELRGELADQLAKIYAALSSEIE